MKPYSQIELIFLWFLTWLTIAVPLVLSFLLLLFLIILPFSLHLLSSLPVKQVVQRLLISVSSAVLSVTRWCHHWALSGGSYHCPSVCPSCWIPCRAVGLASPVAFCFVTQTRTISALHITLSVTPALCLLWNKYLIFVFFFFWLLLKRHKSLFSSMSYRILNKLKQFFSVLLLVLPLFLGMCPWTCVHADKCKRKTSLGSRRKEGAVCR